MAITWSVYQSVLVYEEICKLSRHELAIEIEMLYQQAQWNDQVEIHSNIILPDSAIDQIEYTDEWKVQIWVNITRNKFTKKHQLNSLNEKTDTMKMNHLRIYHECEDGIEIFVSRITDWHHEACRVDNWWSRGTDLSIPSSHE